MLTFLIVNLFDLPSWVPFISVKFLSMKLEPLGLEKPEIESISSKLSSFSLNNALGFLGLNSRLA